MSAERTGAVTMADVARLAGVSPKTVSNVLGGYRGVRQQTRDDVLAAAATLGYRLNTTAQRLKSGRTGAIIFAFPHLTQPYFSQMAERVIEAARAVGLRVIIEPTEGRADRELEILSGARRRLVDGVLFSPAGLTAADVAAGTYEVPVVVLDEAPAGHGVDHVSMANVAASRAATAHLISTGRRRIAALGASPTATANAAGLRQTGYEQALAEAGIPLDPALLVSAGDWDLRASGAEAAARLLHSGVPFDAVFCFNDAMAIGALRTLVRSGLRVPEDVAVIGFDNTEEVRFSVPSISSVDPGQAEIVRASVQLLHSRLTAAPGAEAVGPVSVVADHTVHVRESTGPSRVRVGR